jgi:ubiquinone/menaquinone biosynthesis C-methylase UbiE
MEKYLYEDLYKLEDKHWWHRSKRKICLELIQEYSKKKNLRILDIGCGTGKNVEAFSSLGEVWGLDNSKEAIMFCKKRGLKNLKLGNLDKTGFKDGYFDVVTMLDVLEHLEDQDKALNEIKRILRPNGILIITVPAFSWLWSQWDVVLHHKRRYSNNLLHKVVTRNGLEVLKLSYLYSFLVLPSLIIRVIKSRLNKKSYGSDFSLSNSFIDSILLTLVIIEQSFLKIASIPFGTSLICVSRNV